MKKMSKITTLLLTLITVLMMSQAAFAESTPVNGGTYTYNGSAITTSGVSAWGYHYKWPAESEVVTIHVTFTGVEAS